MSKDEQQKGGGSCRSVSKSHGAPLARLTGDCILHDNYRSREGLGGREDTNT